MPRQIHRFYLNDREPDAETVQSVMKKEVGDCRITGWRVEYRTPYSGKSPDQPGIKTMQCVTVIVGYVKNACNRAIRAEKEITIPFDDPSPNDRKVKEAVKKVVGNVQIIDWRKVNPVQNGAATGKGKFQVTNKSEILVRYIGGNDAESADKNPKKHRLCFNHQLPDDKAVRERMWEEVGTCTILKWYKDEPLAQKNTGLPGLTRVIVEYLEKK